MLSKILELAAALCVLAFVWFIWPPLVLLGGAVLLFIASRLADGVPIRLPKIRFKLPWRKAE